MLQALPAWPERRRSAGALLLTLFLFGQVYAAAHLALVRHSVCALDQELAHGGHEHPLVAPPAGHDEPRAPHLTRRGGPGEHAEHCNLSSLRDERRPWLGAPAPRPAGRTQARPVRLPWRAERRIGRSVLSYAPKHSPPGRRLPG